jgi:hypothetical protein
MKRIISERVILLTDRGTISGSGFGGDFSVGYSIYNYFQDDMLFPAMKSRFPLRATISTGITVLHFTKNPLNVPAISFYLRLSGRAALFDVGLKLELPVINGEVAPRFGLEIGVGYAWAMKRR